jgi:hypothetical protein
MFVNNDGLFFDFFWKRGLWRYFGRSIDQTPIERCRYPESRKIGFIAALPAACTAGWICQNPVFRVLIPSEQKTAHSPDLKPDRPKRQPPEKDQEGKSILRRSKPPN